MANPSRPHPNPISRQVIVEIPHNARAHPNNNGNALTDNVTSPARPPKRKRRRNKLEDRNIYTVSDERVRRLVRQVEKRRGRGEAGRRDVDDGEEDGGNEEDLEEEDQDVGGDGDADGDEDGTRLGSRQTSMSRDGRQSRLLSSTPALQSIPPLDAKEAILPDSDLLIAINHHATTFYHAQSLMYPRARKARLIEARLKKRRLLADQGGLEVTPVPGGGLGEGGEGGDGEEGRRGQDGRGASSDERGRLRRSGRNRRQTDLEGDEQVGDVEGAGGLPEAERSGSDELDTDGESAYGSENLSVHSESADEDEDEDEEGGEGGQSRARRGRARQKNLHQEDEQNTEDDANEEDEVDEDEENEEDEEDEEQSEDEDEDEKDGHSGKYKSRQRDMFRSLDGGALLTLGILLEEYLLLGLQDAGYVVDHTRNTRFASRRDLHDGDELRELEGCEGDDEVDGSGHPAGYDHDDDDDDDEDEDDGLSSD